jgi:multicomponent Na+:H+ antiporter subunit D
VSNLPALCIAAPVLGAVVLAFTARWIPSLLSDIVAIASATATIGCAAALLARTADGRVVSWMGNWTVRGGTSVGIVLAVDRVGAGLALLAASLTLVALIFAWKHLSGSEPMAHALMLVFLAGMCGLSVSGDLFDMFVFFELMSVAAFALTAWKSEEPQSQQGAFTFAVTNSLAAYVTLAGVALVYAHTGELGLAQAGAHFRQEGPSAFALCAFTLVCAGFLTKAAVVPFHFWIADAHAVAPTPVCLLFSGVMVELGLYAIARIWFACFAGAVPEHAVHLLLLCAGVLTAVVGSVMCLVQAHLKRLLAFSTMAHVGLLLVGVSLLEQKSLAGAAWYVLGHAAAKGSLFLAAGVLLNRFGELDQRRLHGRGREMRWLGIVMAVGGLALADLPGFATGAGKDLMEEAGSEAGLAWVAAVFVVVGAVTGGAVLAATGRVFLGLGDPRPTGSEGEEGVHTQREEPDPGTLLDRTPLTMSLPTAALAVASAAVGLLPGLGHQLAAAAVQLADTGGYAAAVLGSPTPPPEALEPVHAWAPTGLLTGALGGLGALAVAALSIWGRELAVLRSSGRAVAGLRRLHSGHIGDYVTWLALGLGLVAGLLALG